MSGKMGLAGAAARDLLSAGRNRTAAHLAAIRPATARSFDRLRHLVDATVTDLGIFAARHGAASGRLLLSAGRSARSRLSYLWGGLSGFITNPPAPIAATSVVQEGSWLPQDGEGTHPPAGLLRNARTVNDAHGADATPPTPFHRLRLLAASAFAVVGVFVIGFGVWATYAPLESAAIAGGAIEAESSRKTIQHLEGGIIGHILVSDGDEVAAGQALISLEDTRARATVQMLQGQLWDAQALEARLVAERDGRETVRFPQDLMSTAGLNPAVAGIIVGQNKIFDTRRKLQASRIEIIQQRKAQTEQEIAGLRFQATAAATRAAIIKGEIAAVAPLVAKRLQTRARLLQLEREQAEIDGRIGDTMSQMSRAGQAIGESRAMILKLESDYQTEIAQSLRDTQAQIIQILERLQAASDVLARTVVRAPEAGTVTDLRVHTPGGVIAAGEPLVDLVPSQDRLIVRALVKPEDIDLVHPGLQARVRLLSYKHRRVPPVDGILTYVSADRLVDDETKRAFYTARIRLSEASLRALPEVEIMPGMPVEVLINTGTFTVAHYALRPVLDSFNRAFRED
ncbi:HlyD family type I secretion periplasmic adaptor subunit [Aminobacter sp. HY435]|uniref:HlyD family type I secretion periplasmic adaptor subunit n=1 Tax=Aminobacter sp. HY435 TaxID=2970917 RepID=UPI0022B95418|nr:HlyD family type I secretion periplasmic adaptor subunit [Aminobacter sp. HY435]